MKKVNLPGMDVKVSRLCLGTVNFGVSLDQDGIRSRLEEFHSMGGNFVDTAQFTATGYPGRQAGRKRCWEKQ